MSFIDDVAFYEEEKRSPLLSHRNLENENVLYYIQPRIRYILMTALRLNSHPSLEFPSIELIEKISGLANLKYDLEYENQSNCKCDPCNCKNPEDCRPKNNCKCGDYCKCDPCNCKNPEDCRPKNNCKCGDYCKCDPCNCKNPEDCMNSSETKGNTSFTSCVLNFLSSSKDDMSKFCCNMFESLSLTCNPEESDYSTNLKTMDESIFKFSEKMPTEEHLRIFKLDGERTFKDPKRQQILVNTLKVLYYMIGDYHQGEGFVTAYLLLFMHPPEVIKLVWILHCFYLNGYFSAVPSSYIRDSMAFIELLKACEPEYAQFLENQITPQAYASKWFIGLTIYVHSIELNCHFIENLVERGQTYLFSYALALVLTMKDNIMKDNDVSKSLEYLRLDNVDDNICKKILEESMKIKITLEEVNKARNVASDALEAQDKARKEREQAMAYSDDEIAFSDEE